MRVVVDTDRCHGNARCVVAAPEVFDVDDDAVVVLLEEHPGPELEHKVELAVRSCPTAAISIEE